MPINKRSAPWTALYLLLFIFSVFTVKSALTLGSKLLIPGARQNSANAASTVSLSGVDALTDETLTDQISKKVLAGGQYSGKPRIINYTVKNGDTLDSIAVNFGLNTSTIAASNNLSKDSLLKEGQQLVFPSIDGIVYRVNSGDTLYNICFAYSIDISSVTDANSISASSILRVGQQLILPGVDSLKAVAPVKKDVKSSGSVKIASRSSSSSSKFGIYPVKGHVTSGFGPRDGEFHKGIDICAPTGTAIYAAADGRVESAGWNNGGYGNLIIIQHSNGLLSYYGHCSKIIVSAGERVTQGQKIGEVGMTGDATGPHCHFEIRVGNNPVNPLNYIR